MTEDLVVWSLLLSTVLLPAVAFLRWYREIPRLTDSNWRSGALRLGIISESANALFLSGYLWYNHHRVANGLELNLGLAEGCAGVGSCLCLVALVGSALGKGRSRLTLAAGAVSGVLIWGYVLISTAESLV